MPNQSLCATELAPPQALPWPPQAILAAARTMAGGSGFAPGLLVTLADPGVDPRRVVEAIRTAPGIALRVLKVANSAFYGRAGQVDSLDRATLLLGLDAVRAMASAACLDRALPAGSGGAQPAPRDLLRHSLATATAAQALCRLIDPVRAADAFLAGLLHDLGYLVVQRLAPEETAQVALELHGECAAQVFGAWNLPSWLASTVRYHHHPERAPEAERALTRIVAAAEQLAAQAGHGLGIEPLTQAVWPLVEHDCDSDSVDTVRRQLPEAIASLGIALGA